MSSHFNPTISKECIAAFTTICILSVFYLISDVAFITPAINVTIFFFSIQTFLMTHSIFSVLVIFFFFILLYAGFQLFCLAILFTPMTIFWRLLNHTFHTYHIFSCRSGTPLLSLTNFCDMSIFLMLKTSYWFLNKLSHCISDIPKIQIF